MRTFIPIVGYAASANTGAYAEVDFMGSGIVGVGPWVLLSGRSIAQESVMVDSPIEVSRCLLTPHLYLAETPTGWLYRSPAPGEYANWEPIDAYPTQGPFADPEDAIRDAVVTLGLKPSWLWESMASVSQPELAGALMVLHELTAPPRDLLSD